MKSIKLGKKFINKNSEPYLIAEIGVNHECSLSLAKKMILLAKKGGADAVKFQTYKAESLVIKNSPAYWDTTKEKIKNQFDLFKKFDCFDKAEYLKLAKYCSKKKINFLSTPFDEKSVDFLNRIVSFFKIASADINNIPLLKKIGKKKKPVLLSTGASTIKEIKNAVKILKKYGSKKILIMHCILNYPTKNSNANIGMITDLIKKFKNNIIGYSDHTLPDKSMSAITTAYLLGARVIEKHFTYNKKIKGNDHYHSMDYKDLVNLKKNIQKVRILVGKKYKKIPIRSEKISIKNARRSIVAKKDINKGEVLSELNITHKRPGSGISVSNWEKLLGKKTLTKIKIDSLIHWKHLHN